jgi:hypothetical protein
MIVVASLTGCTTMIRGTHQKISVSTNPQGADIQFNNGEKCTSPCQVDAKRDRPIQAVINKEGCQQSVVNITSSLSGSSVIMGGFLDFWNGSSHDLIPSNIDLRLFCGNDAEIAAQENERREASRLQELNEVMSRAHAAITPSSEAQQHPDYGKHIIDCDWIATSKRSNPAANALVGAAAGAGLASLFGLALGLDSGYGTLAGASALSGGIAGAAGAANSNSSRYREIMTQCMRDKGHQVY